MEPLLIADTCGMPTARMVGHALSWNITPHHTRYSGHNTIHKCNSKNSFGRYAADVDNDNNEDKDDMRSGCGPHKLHFAALWSPS